MLVNAQEYATLKLIVDENDDLMLTVLGYRNLLEIVCIRNLLVVKDQYVLMYLD
jgi:hypothetical protein